MANQRFKIPPFDRDHYELWKGRMNLYIKTANPVYLQILSKGPFVPMKVIPETTDGGVVIPQRSVPKEASDFSDAERDRVELDTSLQLILVESLDQTMYNHVISCASAKEIWEKIEIMMEGTEEVKENKTQILVATYERFQAKSNEGISEVFERYSKLIADLQLRGKVYTQKEVNIKFLLNLPKTLEHRITAIRESRDLNRTSLEKLFGVLKTYELEKEQNEDSHDKGKGAVSGLVAEDVQVKEYPRTTAATSTETIVAELNESPSNSDDDYFTIEEMESMENKTMAYMASKFSNVRFRKNNRYKGKPSGNKFSKGTYPTGSYGNNPGSSSGYSGGSKSGYKTGMVDRSKFRCFNCNELGHFATECRAPKQIHKKESYDELKKKYDALLRKQQGRAYVVTEGKAWDDSDDEQANDFGNLALMADTGSTSTEVPILSLRANLSDEQNRKNADAFSTEIFNLHMSLVASSEENEKLSLKCRMLEARVEELEGKCNEDTLLKESNEYLEHKLKIQIELEAYLREQLAESQVKCEAYKATANSILVDSTTHKNITGVEIGFDYSKKNLNRPINFGVRDDATKEGTPSVLKCAVKPLFRQFLPRTLNEDDVLLNYEILQDTLNDNEHFETPKKTVRINTPKFEKNSGIGIKGVKEKYDMATGRLDDYSDISVRARKSCYLCNSTEHIQYKCPLKKVELHKSISTNMPIMHSQHVPCGQPNCMPCVFNVMNAYMKLMGVSHDSCINSPSMLKKKHVKSETVSPPKARMDTRVPKLDSPVVVDKGKGKVEDLDNIKVNAPISTVKDIVFRSAGPKQAWVPKKA